MRGVGRFFVELRRRRVFRTAGAYIFAAWVVLQVADLALGALGLPERALSHVWLALMVGFPLALVFGWRYDITASGIVRTPPGEVGDPSELALQRADYVVLIGLAAMTVVIVFGVLAEIGQQVETAGEAPGVPTGDDHRIAVLPLENLSGTPEQDYLAAGMHDALITSLSKIASLRVISRTSTLRIKDNLSLPEIAIALGVTRIVAGAVTREGDRVRMNVQLIDARTDSHLWADSFERNFSGLLSLQDDLARAIARAIRIQLTPEEEQRLGGEREVDPETYDAYLRGMYLLHQDTRQSFRRGMEILREAVERDPTSALAYAGLAYGYGKIGHSFFPDRSANPRLKLAASRALELDDSLAEAHLAMGMYQLYSEWDWRAAEYSLQRAIELNGSLVAAHYHLAWLLELLGRDEEALAAGELTEELDPLSPFYSGWLADQYRDAGLYDEAIAHARSSIELNPSYPVGWFVLGTTYAEMRRCDEAIDAHQRLEGMPFWSWGRALSFVCAGRLDDVYAILESLGDDPDNSIPLALVNAVVGDEGEMLRWLHVARDDNMPWYPWLVVWFSPMRPYYHLPAFRDLAAELRLDLPRGLDPG